MSSSDSGSKDELDESNLTPEIHHPLVIVIRNRQLKRQLHPYSEPTEKCTGSK